MAVPNALGATFQLRPPCQPTGQSGRKYHSGPNVVVFALSQAITLHPVRVRCLGNPLPCVATVRMRSRGRRVQLNERLRSSDLLKSFGCVSFCLAFLGFLSSCLFFLKILQRRTRQSLPGAMLLRRITLSRFYAAAGLWLTLRVDLAAAATATGMLYAIPASA